MRSRPPQTTGEGAPAPKPTAASKERQPSAAPTAQEGGGGSSSSSDSVPLDPLLLQMLLSIPDSSVTTDEQEADEALRQRLRQFGPAQVRATQSLYHQLSRVCEPQRQAGLKRAASEITGARAEVSVAVDRSRPAPVAAETSNVGSILSANLERRQSTGAPPATEPAQAQAPARRREQAHPHVPLASQSSPELSSKELRAWTAAQPPTVMIEGRSICSGCGCQCAPSSCWLAPSTDRMPPRETTGKPASMVERTLRCPRSQLRSPAHRIFAKQ